VWRVLTLVAAGLISATGVLALRGLAAAPIPTASSHPGQALYAMYCAVCHGEAGKGDGLSASGFATKPRRGSRPGCLRFGAT
jgi:mono/diheme cytochrome c family protein